MFHISPQDPAEPDAAALIQQLSDTLAAITGDSGASSFDPDDVRGSRAVFVVAHTAEGLPAGCGALRPVVSDDVADVAEIKRMYARPMAPGAGSAVLGYLESVAAQMGYREIWLETRRANHRAIGFYERHGYRPIPAFGRYVDQGDAVCLGKSLEGAADVRSLPAEHLPVR
ncbi:GNAT family N-acetyltransferase [Paracidovorax konjaci]|uniref:Acetyltransferase (GNAT) family protein n=1 Tax=Paracidovorax konjaci TaxID=32040 RepID=A0A1I1ZKY6_9BURK|nr:GNAT family N-acetyltransferase [Paracidovorax konjaci]SFE32028.1 Acetyltransferase (GNAT) family protein [Paracidovorax konjaci]